LPAAPLAEPDPLEPRRRARAHAPVRHERRGPADRGAARGRAGPRGRPRRGRERARAGAAPVSREAELAAEFERYERALVAGDAATLAELFWASERTVRFGVADHQVGHEAIRAWRATVPPLPPGRELEDTRVVALGDDVGVVTTLF